MTRYAIDAAVALRIVRGELEVPAADQLVGPAVLRSHVMAELYRQVRAGELDEPQGRAQLDGLAGLRVRLLGDRVSRGTAWKVATRLGWDDVGPAEYLAVAVLQADTLVTDDPLLTAAATDMVRTAPSSALAHTA